MPRVTRIYSENNDFQYVDALRRNREKRHRSKEFFVEGVRAINQALAHDWRITSFLYTRERPLSDWAEGILAHSRAERHLELPLQLLGKLSAKDNPSELIALVAMPEDRLSRIAVHDQLRVIVFDRPASPGNLGTTIRSCDAFRGDGMVITGHGVDLYDPETIRATTGSFFATPVVRVPSPRDLCPWLEGLRGRLPDLCIVGSSEKATIDVSEHDLSRPTVLIVGNETWGMSAFYRDLCDVIVKIPMGGSASSLNVACATTVLLYELDRQRREAGADHGMTVPGRANGEVLPNPSSLDKQPPAG